MGDLLRKLCPVQNEGPSVNLWYDIVKSFELPGTILLSQNTKVTHCDCAEILSFSTSKFCLKRPVKYMSYR